MSGPDPKLVGSNWKILQQRLQAENKLKGETSELKRKRPAEKGSGSKTSNGFKRAKFDFKSANGTALGKRRKMGGSVSTATKEADLAKDHDIPQADIAEAYGTTATTKKRASFADEINGGLHPTNKVGKYIALDCEMVGTGPPPHLDNVLARASLVNFHGEQIYDSYVQPPAKVRIEDYRTYVSGIKPHHLKPGYARTFAEVQQDVAKLLEGRILVGHALRNDLSALILSHPKRDLRDTSRHPKFRIESKGKPPALRNLARSELGLEIQTGEHSSVEDARATMLLFQKEKRGFEEENRRQYGQRKVLAVKEKVKEDEPDVDDDEEEQNESEDEEEDDLDLLSGEELEEALAKEASKQTQQARKKKTKKKKRTKRK
ncbi:putative ribonuclease H-like superfamily, exonuclease, RNase T/DNA polymerase III [Septoria linicola]|nr:putative ribonuclease H-like superfamily, exonuclease, RNase T/DNA polymerase III [Septoria linicola]